MAYGDGVRSKKEVLAGAAVAVARARDRGRRLRVVCYPTKGIDLMEPSHCRLAPCSRGSCFARVAPSV